MSQFLFENITYEIIGSAYEVYNFLGYGFLEKVYERSLIFELQNKGLTVENQKVFKVFYKNQLVGDYVADIFVNESIIVELKSEKEYSSKHESQVINYLKASGLKLGLLINFGETSCKIKRLIL